MKKFFFLLALCFLLLFFTNLGWIIVNSFMWITYGFESIIHGENLIENIYYSNYIKWILLADSIWGVFALIFVYQRKQFKTDEAHFLHTEVIGDPKICVTMPAYNEEKAINENKGFSHSYVLGLKESLKTDANVIVITESDGTFNANDINKLLPYLENCDVVTGSRSHQVLTEKGNQNGRLHVYGNMFLAKIIQLKYFSLNHLGTVNLTDVGCGFMIMKRTALEKLIEDMSILDTNKSIWNMSLRFYTILLSIEKNLRIIEIPITFKKRIGESKYSGQSISKSLKIGFNFLWLIFIH